MLAVEMSKCKFCGAPQTADASVCSSCGTKLRRAAGKSAGNKRKPAPFGLNSAALLDKINALDWDPTTTMSGPSPAAPMRPAPDWRFLVAPVLTGLTILVVGAAALLFFTGTPVAPATKETVRAELSTSAAPGPVVVATAATETTDTPSPAGEEVREAERVAERDKVLRSAEDAAQRRAEKKRKTLAEQQAREEQERQRRAEDERRRAEQEAAEARARAAAAAPAPKAPASPRELCASEDGFFARNTCEARACGQPEWRHHAFCVKRWQDEMRKLNPAEGR